MNRKNTQTASASAMPLNTLRTLTIVDNYAGKCLSI